MENPHALSEFNKLPKFHAEKARGREAKEIEAKGLEGLIPWERHHPLNHRYVPVATQAFKQLSGT